MRIFNLSAALTLFVGLAASAAHAEPTLRPVIPAEKRVQMEFKLRGDIGERLAKANETCEIQTIACGETVTSTLTTQDCDFLGDGTFVDPWAFDGNQGDVVTIDLTSGDFDTFLFLLNPAVEVAATDDDGGGGTNSQIDFQLDASGEWTILANNFNEQAGDPGEYTLSLQCAAGPPPTIPAAPSDLAAQPQSPTEILLTWRDNSNNESGFPVEVAGPGFGFTEIGAASANSQGVIITGLEPETTYQFRVRARNSAGDSAYSNVAEATTPDDTGCFPSLTTLCLHDGRFAVQTAWQTAEGLSGVGFGENINDHTGAFVFFSPDNVEVVVKVLDACDMPQPRFWVFAGGLTNVMTELTVTDTESGEVNTYRNPLGMAFDPIQDTDAFATCP